MMIPSGGRAPPRTRVASGARCVLHMATSLRPPVGRGLSLFLSARCLLPSQRTLLCDRQSYYFHSLAQRNFFSSTCWKPLCVCVVGSMDRSGIGPSWEKDSDKPIFHVMPRDGWLNDPNGPIYYAGKYHIFYQHVIGSSQWDWGLVWGHASSTDLVNWYHEPVAIEPTVSAYDADGCWSGNIAIDQDGTPTLLYTGVRLRTKETSIPLPPPAVELDLEQIESQCVAQCKSGDKHLRHWQKLAEPVLQFPPSDLGKLTGFRDPFVFSRKTDGSPWKIIVGSGIKGKGGTVLLYHAEQLSSGWEYKGELVNGVTKPCQDGDYDLGAVWECPFLTRLPQVDGNSSSGAVWMLCVSPYPHFRDDRPTNPCLYWLGSFDDERFMLGNAAGPRLLDLGDVLYAPTLFSGSERCMMVAWLQELRKGGLYDYAGCLSVPRILSVQGQGSLWCVEGRLRQDPAEEINQLRTGIKWETSDVTVLPSQSYALEGPPGQALDIVIDFERREAGATGMLLKAWLTDTGEGVACTEALVVDWEASELQVVAPNNLDTRSMTFDSSQLVKKVGGQIHMPEGKKSLGLRILLDHSLLEVFTECGQTLTTRVYRAATPTGADPRLFLFSLAGTSNVHRVEVHEMRSVWSSKHDLPEQWTATD